MKIILIEGHRKVYYLLDSLSKRKHHKLVVINQDKDYCKVLSRKFPDAVIIHGDATKNYILEDAQIRDFDLSIHLSYDDKINLVSALSLNKCFNVQRNVTVVNESKNVEVFYGVGIDTTIDTSRVLANIIEQHAFVEKLKTYMPLEDENLILLNLEVSSESNSIGKKIQSLTLPSDAIIAAIFRDKKTIIPNGNTMIESGDRIFVTTLKKVQNKVVKALIG